ncbi:MAG: TauD/TfdA family dioxygenase [Crocinitomix sp.]|nr:TauD/TfdA family dioxygenase [Crocinitomix sp.]
MMILTYTQTHTHTLESLNTIKLSVSESLKTDGYFLTRTNTVSIDDVFSFLTNIGDLWMPEFPVIDVQINQGNRLYAFTNSKIPPHNECCHEEIPPLWICLFCVGVEEEGGEFYLVNTKNSLGKLEPEYFEKLNATKFIVRSAKTNYQVERGLFQMHPLSKEKSLLYTTIGCYSIKSHGFQSKENDPFVLKKLNEHLLKSTEDYQYHKWQKGDLIIFDNYKFMHGRMAFAGLERHLKHIRLVPKK